MSTLGGYHEYIEGVSTLGDIMMHVGDIMSTSGMFSTLGDTMSTSGDIMSTSGMFSTSGGYHDTCGGASW